MFIYKITIQATGESYIGLDSKPSYKNARWKSHVRNYSTGTGKLYNKMKKYGLKNCSYEIIEDGFECQIKLAIAEIMYIEQYDTYKNGLNMTLGGDGINQSMLDNASDDEYELIKSKIGSRFRNLNRKKWENTTEDQRKEFTQHLHTSDVYDAKSVGMLNYWNEVDSAKRNVQLRGLKRKRTPDDIKAAIKNAAKATEKNKIPHKVILPSGEERIYDSYIDLVSDLNIKWIKYRLSKGENEHLGYKFYRLPKT